MSTKAKSKAKPQTASRVLETVYETASALERFGFIDKRKMQKLDALCMEPIAPYDSAQIRALREPPSSTPNPDFSPFCASGLNKIKHLQLIF
jgi:DNA-binding transcriptional regulator YiaG